LEGNMYKNETEKKSLVLDKRLSFEGKDLRIIQSLPPDFQCTFPVRYKSVPTVCMSVE